MTHADKVKKYMKAHKGISLGEASKAVAEMKSSKKSSKRSKIVVNISNQEKQ